MLSIGNYFKTEEEAQFIVEKLKVIKELKDFATEHNEPIDWDDIRQNKYYLYYNYSNGSVENDYDQNWKQSTIYFSSAEVCKQAIEKIGEERIKKYYLEVEE